MLNSKMVFIVASDDHKWCQEMFATENDVIMTNFDNSAELDLAILSQCDHSIIRLVLINKRDFTLVEVLKMEFVFKYTLN